MDFRFVLVLGLLSSLSVSFLTWYAVVQQGTAVELTPQWASLFSAYGAWGVVGVGAGKILLLLFLYLLHPPLSVFPCTLYLLDLVHDLSVFFFGSSPFLFLLGGPDALLALFLTLLAARRFPSGKMLGERAEILAQAGKGGEDNWVPSSRASRIRRGT